MVDSEVKPLWFIWVLQWANAKIINHHDLDHGEDQNMGLHDLVSQLVMCRTDTTLKITVSSMSRQVNLDAGYCPFCPYYVSSHRTLNNHVRAHLWLSMFCGIGSCFFPSHSANTMVEHAMAAHKDVYQRSTKLT